MTNRPYDRMVSSEPIGDMNAARVREVFCILAKQHPGRECYLLERLTVRPVDHEDRTLGAEADGCFGWSVRSQYAVDEALNRFTAKDTDAKIALRYALRVYAGECTDFDQRGRYEEDTGSVIGVEPAN